MKKILNAYVAPALYYMVLDYISHRENNYDYMMQKFQTTKTIELTLEQFNELVTDAVEHFKKQSELIK